MSPPSIITGDPFALEPGRCILVVGINPGWPNAEMQKTDCVPAHQAWESGFDGYRTHRRVYFQEMTGEPGRTKNADPRYNGRHFSRLGNTLARALGVAHEHWDAGANARQFFRQRAAILDLIPYWSRNTKNLNLAAALQKDCIRQWCEVVSAFIREKRPQIIVVNNRGEPVVINGMLGCEIAPVAGVGLLGGRTGADNLATPVLAHPFLSRWRITRQTYIEQFTEALRILGVPRPILGP
ncbi:hypothetical protein SCH01S_45_00220 [Sphingomonas changbaiensis NBRC 104936]|uniref:Uracil-DNA glycosylase-like domain-containing protein n=2 Tax=Sphingomonas changbaiensis TaxID=529705 RepID=A0A0E9MRJ6_9SPHN|nr:hypothetical protein SCH01S_45_00220 [Sphingomonas changbaiensis NBRC 104936]